MKLCSHLGDQNLLSTCLVSLWLCRNICTASQPCLAYSIPQRRSKSLWCYCDFGNGRL